MFDCFGVAATDACAAEPKATDEENTILTLVLKRPYPDGGFTVVHPDTGLSHLGSAESREIKQTEKYIAEHLQTNGILLAKLVDRLFGRNSKPISLTLNRRPRTAT